jgi:hypothetical protein
MVKAAALIQLLSTLVSNASFGCYFAACGVMRIRHVLWCVVLLNVLGVAGSP